MMMVTKENAAMNILMRVSGNITARKEIVEIKEALSKETGP